MSGISEGEHARARAWVQAAFGDDLRAVAAVYREADEAGNEPVQVVMRKFIVSRSTASRWVRLARERRFLRRERARRARSR